MHRQHRPSRLLLHLLFWLAAGGVWYFLRYQDYASPLTALWVTAIKILDLAALIYLANYVLIPRLLYRKRYAAFLAVFLSVIGLSSLLKMQLIGRITNNPNLVNWAGEVKTRIYDNILPHIFLVVAGVAVKLVFDQLRMQQRLAEVGREKAEAELHFLKSQINPHFLFNSLNSVYFLIDKGNAEARNALHRFSEMLRYQLYEVGDSGIPIERELAYLRDYVALQSLRNERLQVEWELGEGMVGFRLAPLLLIPFVENAFKHLSHFGDRPDRIRIALGIADGQLRFRCDNTTEDGVHPAEVGGIGLTNVRRRLDLLYPGAYALQCGREGAWYRVSLTLNLNAYGAELPDHR